MISNLTCFQPSLPSSAPCSVRFDYSVCGTARHLDVRHVHKFGVVILPMTIHEQRLPGTGFRPLWGRHMQSFSYSTLVCLRSTTPELSCATGLRSSRSVLGKKDCRRQIGRERIMSLTENRISSHSSTDTGPDLGKFPDETVRLSSDDNLVIAHCLA